MCIKDKPCKVSAVSTSKTGKHGHAKCNFTALDIFTGKKYEDIIPATHTAHIPVVTRKDYDLIDISDDGFMTLMDEDGETKEDLKLPEAPENYGRELTKAFEAASETHSDIVFGKIDTQAEQALAAQLQIRSIPTLMVFRDGIRIFNQAGALPAPVFEDLIQQVKTVDMADVKKQIASEEG